MIAISGYSIANGNMDHLAWKFDMDLKNCSNETGLTKGYSKKLFTRIIPDITAA